MCRGKCFKNNKKINFYLNIIIQKIIYLFLFHIKLCYININRKDLDFLSQGFWQITNG